MRDYRYYNSTKWNEKKALVFRRADWKCEICGISDVVLDCHHLTYVRFGDELIEDLKCVCRPCHCKIHGRLF